MQHCLHPHCSYSNASFYNVRKHIAKCRFKKSRVLTTCAPSNEQSSTLPVENVMTSVPALMCPEDDVSREHLIIDDYMQEEHARACIYDWAEVISELYDSGRERHAKRIVALLHAETFELNGIRETLKDVPACIRFVRETGNESLKENGFRKLPVSIEGTSATRVSNVYKRNVVEVLKNQIEMCASPSNLQLRTHPKQSFRHPMETAYFSMLEGKTRQRILRNGSQQVFWNDDSNAFPKSFAGFVQIFSDKTASSLKGSALVAYPVHAVLLNFSDAYKRWLVQSGHSLVAFLPVECAAEQQGGYTALVETEESLYGYSSSAVVEVRDWIPVTSSTDGRELKIRVLHKAMSIILSEIEEICLQGFPGRTGWNQRVNCFPILASYCCDIPEGKDMSGIRHGTSVRRPCIRCMSTMADFQAIRCEEARSIQDTLEVRKCCSELAEAGSSCHDEGVRVHTSLGRKNANDRLKDLSLSQNSSFLEDSELASTSVLGKVYDIFGFEPLHNLHLGISKLLKECTFKFLGSDKVMTKPGGVVEQRQPLSRMRVCILRGVNSLLAAIERDAGVPGLNVDFSSKGCSMQLNGLFLNSGVRGMLEGKDYRAVDMVFPIIGAYIDRATGFHYDANMTGVHRMYSDMVSRVVSQNYGQGWSVEELEKLRRDVRAFKHKVVNMFSPVCTSGLFTLKFHLLDHLVEDISRFGGISALDASPYEQFNTTIKAAYRHTSKRRATRMDETVFGLDQMQSNAPWETSCGSNNFSPSVSNEKALRIERDGSYLVRSSWSVSLGDLRSELSLGNNPSPESGNVGRLFKMFSSHAVKVLVDLVTETLVQVGQPYASHEVVLAVSRSGYVPGGIVPSLEDYDEQRNIIRNIPVAENFIQRVFACEEFGSNKAMKNSFVVIEGKEEETPVLWIAKVVLLFSLKGQADRSEREYAFLQYMDCTGPLDGIDKELGCVCLRWSTTDEIDHTMSEDDNREFSVGEWFGLEPLSAIRGVVHVVRSNYSVKPFGIASAWPYHRFYLNRFYRNEKVPEHRLDSGTVEFK